MLQWWNVLTQVEEEHSWPQEGGYITLPDTSKLRVAKVFDGGNKYSKAEVQSTISGVGDRIHTVKGKILNIPRPARPDTPLSEKQQTENLIHHLDQFFSVEKLPLSMRVYHGSKFSDLCWFSGGGDVTIYAKDGVVIIGGTCIDDLMTPWREGDVPITSCIENKLTMNTTSYEDTELQLFVGVLCLVI